MYVEASQACNTLAFQLGTSNTNSMWTVAVTQYECSYTNLAPQGCTQWYFGSNTGLVKTYNYQSGAGSGVALADQKHNMCIRYYIRSSSHEMNPVENNRFFLRNSLFDLAEIMIID